MVCYSDHFTTLTPCTAPLNATTTGITLTAATLDWDAVSGAWGYRVRYKANLSSLGVHGLMIR